REGPAAGARPGAGRREGGCAHAPGGDRQWSPRGAAPRAEAEAAHQVRRRPGRDLSEALPGGGRATDEDLDRRAQGLQRHRHPSVKLPLLAAGALLLPAPALAIDLHADPTTYEGAVAILGPGDTL